MIDPPVSRVHVADEPEADGASWSNTLRIGNEIVLSGATAHPATGLDAHAQTVRILERLLARVVAAGGTRGSLYKLVVYLTDIADKDAVGQARRDFFAGAPYPCSTLVQVSGLVFPELKIEIDAWARVDVDLSTCR